MSVYAYHRVSTQRQADEGQSLDVQARTCDGYAMMNGLVIDRSFTEAGVSGSIMLRHRPTGAEMLKIVRAGDTIITAKLDRMFRSALDALEVLAILKSIGVSLHMIDLGGDVTGNGISKLVFTILSAVAEAERDRIKERICTVKADQKARGAYLGGHIPFGQRVVDGMLVPKEDEQPMVKLAIRMRADGKSLRAIQAAIYEHGDRVVSLDAINRVCRAI